ncbi:MAG TPA: YetF domain-containing protein [Gaiellaceae bacterium]|nr:YetF domain-containing protein [Gaiellaceae bacterium]
MDVVLRAAFVFAFLFVLMRVIGRRELSSLEPFDLIVLIVLGDLVQQGVTQDDYSITGVVLAIGTIAALQVGVSYANFRFPRLRPLLDGEPIVIVQDGTPIDRNLRRERLTLDDLAEQARLQNIGSLDEVAWAVMETSGQISFVKKSGS